MGQQNSWSRWLASYQAAAEVAEQRVGVALVGEVEKHAAGSVAEPAAVAVAAVGAEPGEPVPVAT